MSLLKVNEVQNYNGSSLTLTASTVSTSAQLNTGGNVSVTGSINVSDDSTTRSNLGLGTMATQNANAVAITGGTINAVAITGGTINTVQPATGQSLTIKDEDGNTAITVGTDNTATGYLSLNFGSHSSSTGSLTSSTLSDYEEGNFSPTVSSTSGTITTVSANGFYRKIGTTVICFIDFTVTTNGTGAGLGIISNLPFTTTASSESSGAMRIDGFNGATATYTLDKSSTSIVLTKYDNSYPFGNNARGTLIIPYIVA